MSPEPDSVERLQREVDKLRDSIGDLAALVGIQRQEITDAYHRIEKLEKQICYSTPSTSVHS